MQIVFRWSYLVLAVDELHWGWSQGMNQQQLVPRGPWMGWCGMEPPVTEVNSWASWALGEYAAYSPELNPAKRVFVRREERSLEAKSSAIEHLLATEGANHVKRHRLGLELNFPTLNSAAYKLAMSYNRRIRTGMFMAATATPVECAVGFNAG